MTTDPQRLVECRVTVAWHCDCGQENEETLELVVIPGESGRVRVACEGCGLESWREPD